MSILVSFLSDAERSTPGAVTLAPPGARGAQVPLSGSEVSILWHFIQGSIMLPEARTHLQRGWGMCPRHATAWMIVESAFRHGYLHGPAVLYDDLMESAVAAFRLRGPFSRQRLASRLRARSPCYLCGLGARPDVAGFIRNDQLRTGRDGRPWQAFMAETRRSWRADVCGVCSRSSAPGRCRRHLCAEIIAGREPDLNLQAEMTQRVATRVRRYAGTFCWELRGTDTREDRAGLVSAVGWCSGWSELLALDAVASA